MGFAVVVLGEDDIDEFSNGLMWWDNVLNVHDLFFLHLHDTKAVFFELWNID